jgi:hypothetical protein
MTTRRNTKTTTIKKKTTTSIKKNITPRPWPPKGTSKPQ